MLSNLRSPKIPKLAMRYRKMSDINPSRDASKKGTGEEMLKLEKMEHLIIRSSGKNSLLRAKKILAERGSWILIFSRFIPGIRSLLVIAAASSGMKKSTVFLCTSLSIALWYALLVFAGTVIGTELEGASDFMAELTAVLLMISIAVVIISVIISLVRMKRSE